MATWMVYVLVSTTKTLTYVGCTTDVSRRLRQHNGEIAGGGKFTRRGRPWVLGRVLGPFEGRGAAQVAEHRMKRLRGLQRLTGTPG